MGLVAQVFSGYTLQLQCAYLCCARFRPGAYLSVAIEVALHVPASSAVLVVKTACSGWEGAPVAALCEE